MLVLLSFGLVLVATVLLVLGLLSDAGLTLIYVSIGASALAGLSLMAAVRLSRPDSRLGSGDDAHAPVSEPQVASDPVPEPEPVPEPVPEPEPEPLPDPVPEPEPLPDPAPPVVLAPAPAPPVLPVVEPPPPTPRPAPVEAELPDLPDRDEVDPDHVVHEAAAAPVEPEVETVIEPVVEPVVDPVPAVVPVAPTSRSVQNDDDDDVEFPIYDYDDLTVDEIMPLLPQLFLDELDVVLARERATKDRPAVLARINKLRATGTDVESSRLPKVVLEPDRVRPAADPVEPARVGLDVFPVQAYDTLTVAQIMPLLRQLEEDELVDVRSRESAGAARATILTFIAERLGEQPPKATAAATKKRAPAKKKATKKRAPAKKQATAKKRAPGAKSASKKSAPRT